MIAHFLKDKQEKQLAANIVCVCVGVCIGYGMFHQTQSDEKVIVEETKESKVVVNYISHVIEEKKKEKEENVDRVITRTVAVPCNCQDKNSVVFVSDGSDKEGMVPSLSFAGMQIISEHIEEHIKKNETETEKKDTNIAVSKKEEQAEQKKEEKEIQKGKELDWVIGIGASYNWNKKMEEYQIKADRRIVGPFWLGAELKMDRELAGSIGVNVSVGF